jgi:hypothetical protein
MTNRPYIAQEHIKDSMGNTFDLRLYKRYLPSNEATRYEYSLLDPDNDNVVPEQIGSFEFLVNKNDDYAIADEVYLDVNYRGHNLYRIILDHAKKFFKSIGLKGIMSKGSSRSEDATRSWEKIKTRQEQSPKTYGTTFTDFFLERKTEMKHIELFERYEVPQDVRDARIKTISKIAKEEGLRTDGDFIMLYHGTSRVNMDKIVKSGKLHNGTWFAKTFKEAERYALTKVNSPKKSAVEVFFVYMGSLTYNGYFTTQEELLFKNGKYAPKS